MDQLGNQVGIVNLKEALYQAEIADLDLVEISPNADPPVCRIMDYGKYLFEASKKKATQKKRQRVQVKEVKFRPVTDSNDYTVKVKKIKGFLSEGNKVKVTVRFRGRELIHPELGMYILQKVEKDIEEVGLVEQQAKSEGKQIIMVVGPHRQ